MCLGRSAWLVLHEIPWKEFLFLMIFYDDVKGNCSIVNRSLDGKQSTLR